MRIRHRLVRAGGGSSTYIETLHVHVHSRCVVCEIHVNVSSVTRHESRGLFCNFNSCTGGLAYLKKNMNNST